MSKILFFGHRYDSRIEEGNVILDSLDAVYIIEGLGDKIEIDADYEFRNEGGIYRMGWAEFYGEFIENYLQTYVDNNREHAQKVHDLSKNLN